jgi:hypothetical protein
MNGILAQEKGFSTIYKDSGKKGKEKGVSVPAL